MCVHYSFRYKLSSLTRAPQCPEEMKGIGLALDEILAMARWRSEDILKSLVPLQRAALAIEVASNESRTFSKHNATAVAAAK